VNLLLISEIQLLSVSTYIPFLPVFAYYLEFPDLFYSYSSTHLFEGLGGVGVLGFSSVLGFELRTQGFVLARKAFYCLSHASRTLSSRYF
jgi:hypothetical protein